MHIFQKGNTPIHLACYYNHKDVVETLLDNGVDVNIKSKVRRSSFFFGNFFKRETDLPKFTP